MSVVCVCVRAASTMLLMPQSVRGTRRQSRRMLLLDLFIFTFVGVWIGSALHSHFTVGKLHEVMATHEAHREAFTSEVGFVSGNATDMSGRADATVSASLQKTLVSPVLSTSSPLLTEAGWEWNELSGFFGGGGGKDKPNKSELAPVITVDTLEKMGAVHTFRRLALSRFPRMQFLPGFASESIVRSALRDAGFSDAAGGDDGYDPSKQLGLRALKTHVVNATFYPSVVSSPWKVYRIAAGATGGGDGDKNGDFFEPYPFNDNLFDKKYEAVVGDTKLTMLVVLQAPVYGGEVIIPLEGITDPSLSGQPYQPISGNVRAKMAQLYQQRSKCGKVPGKDDNDGLMLKLDAGDALVIHRTYPNNYIDIKALFGLCRVGAGDVDLIVAAIDAKSYDAGDVKNKAM